MANFKPLKKYLLCLIDELVEKHGLSGPFLDVGCGIGDISLHFAKKGWTGKAIDISGDAVMAAKKTLAQYKDKVSIEQKDALRVEGQYKTIFLCDVLEHAVNDKEILESVKKKIAGGKEGGCLIISVPVFRKEWRWDDRFYGHVRRYEIDELAALLKTNDFEILDIWDFSFPVFWFLRRVYTRILPEKIILGKSRKELTRKSSLQSSWDKGILTTIVEKVIWWRPVFYLQSRFRKRLLGCECVLAARLVH